MLGPIDWLAPVIEYLVLVLIVVNMGTRHLQHRHHRRAFDADAESLARHPVHTASNVALVLGAFYLLTVQYHAGLIFSVLVLGLVITDFFEVESRRVELRTGGDLEAPKAAIVASGLAFLYAFYISLFFLLEPAWRLVF